MLTKQEKQEWILKNCVDSDGDIDLAGLDFSKFEGNIYIHYWNVKHHLIQNGHVVGGSINQGKHSAQGAIYQSNHIVDGSIFQNQHEVSGSIHQEAQTTKMGVYCGCKSK